MDKLKRKIQKYIIHGVKMLKKMRRSDLTSGMLRVMVFCWLIPYLAISIFFIVTSQMKTDKQVNDTIETSLENAASLTSRLLNGAIEESKQASRDGDIRASYLKYKQISNSDALKNETRNYLTNLYKFSEEICAAHVVFYHNPSMECFVYSNVAGATYATVGEFSKEAKGIVLAEARTLGTGSKYMVVSGRLYLVRNLVTSDFNPFAVIIFEINTDKAFESIKNVVWREDSMIFVDKGIVKTKYMPNDEIATDMIVYANNSVLDTKLSHGTKNVKKYDSDNMYASLSMKFNEQRVSFVIKLDETGILNEKSTLIYIYVVVILLLVPLVFATIYFFYSNVRKPIDSLMKASEKIEDGEYGYRAPEFTKNEDFGRLVRTFNDMSESLEQSFNRIYAEEVAVRDANMQALQAQINPHFLNNTLEIINWKARIAGNYEVSGMIGALSVMMEATMNRNKESFISIREELKYVDAYLYIIDQRFGEKFTFEREVDESLLDIKIPRLIVQPIVENMVEHGCDENGCRTGKLRIFEDNKYLNIIVENKGNLTDVDKAKIELLLSDNDTDSKLKNIGIKNVNLRLKMLYGEYSGLTITNPEDGITESKVLIEKRKLDGIV